MELPEIAFDPCEKVSTRVNSLSLVRCRSNDYSVPTIYGYHDVQVRGYFDRVVIGSDGEIIACHARSYAKEDREDILQPLIEVDIQKNILGANNDVNAEQQSPQPALFWT